MTTTTDLASTLAERTGHGRDEWLAALPSLPAELDDEQAVDALAVLAVHMTPAEAVAILSTDEMDQP